MAYATISDDGTSIYVHTLWTEKELIRQVPGVSWKSDDRVWKLPLSWASCVTLRGVFGGSLSVDPKLNEWALHERESRIDTAQAIRLLTEPPPQPNGWRVINEREYPFQVVGSEFLLRAGDALSGDEMGTGKTIQAIVALAHAHDALPALVICPNSVKSNWADELATWYPEATPYVVTGGAVGRRKILKTAKNDPSAVVITNIESLRLLSRLSRYGSQRLARCRECDKKYGDVSITPARCEVHPKELNEFGFKTVIIDEAHRIANPQSKQTRAAWAVMHGKTVTRRWGLTGTPMLSHLGHLWSIMHAIAPHEYPTKSAWIDRYAIQSYTAFGGIDVVGLRPDTRDEFFSYFDPRFRRMPKSLVLAQLPPKTRSVRTVTMTPKQRKAYAEIKKNFATILDSGEILITPNNVTAFTRLTQLASSYADVTPDPNDATKTIVKLKEPSPKLDEMELILDELNGAKVAICAESRQLIEMAAERLTRKKIPYVMIVGGMTEWERSSSLRSFQEGDAQVILFTMQAGGTGLTMSAAGVLIRLQRSWSMVTNVQTEDRVHRIGSERHASVHIIDIVTEDTIETERQLPKLYEKLYRLAEITRDRATIMANNGDTIAIDEEEARILKSMTL